MNKICLVNLFDDVDNLKPVIIPGNSDSASLDNVFEILTHSGKLAPLIKTNDDP